MSEENKGFWVVGENYFIRTVTMYHVGKLKEVDGSELVFEKASWVADCGRFNNMLVTGYFDEVEPFTGDVLVNRTSIIDATKWVHALPDQVK